MYFVEKQGAELLNEAIALRVVSASGIDPDRLRGLFEASRHQQILIAKTESGEPLATLAFARISKFTLKLIAGSPAHKLRPYEYGEGKILYVEDGFFRKHTLRKSLALLAPQLKRYRLIAFVRKDKLRVFYNGGRSMRPVKLSLDQPASWALPMAISTGMSPRKRPDKQDGVPGATLRP